MVGAAVTGMAVADDHPSLSRPLLAAFERMPRGDDERDTWHEQDIGT